MSWKSIIGQQRIKQLLEASLKQGRLAHAYLFVGEAGLGKYQTALELAKCVNCQQSPFDACDNCPSCSRINDLNHPNLQLVFPLPRPKDEKAHHAPLEKLSTEDIDAIKQELRKKAKNSYHQIRLERASEIKINSIREVRRHAALTSFGTGRKVFIILNAEKMNDESANAFLKTLEEPTPDTLIILLTAQPEALLPTIVSRCQIMRFDPLSEKDIKEALVNHDNVPEKDAALAARLADGSFLRARQYIDPGTMERKEKAVNFLRTVLYKSRKEINELIVQLDNDNDRRDFSEMFMFLQQWFRDAMQMREGAAGNRDIPDRESIDRFNNSYPSWQYTNAIETLERSISLLDKNVYIPLILINVAHNLRRAVGARKTN